LELLFIQETLEQGLLFTLIALFPDGGTAPRLSIRIAGKRVMTFTYATDGSPEFNAGLHQQLLMLADDVERAMGDNLVALILGGGYGRGEGGVIRDNGREMPYNDLDFTIVVARKSKVPWNDLKAIGDSYGSQMSIEVDFSRPLTLSDVQQWPHWLMWSDLLNGHVTLKGAPDILLSHAPSYLKQPLPAIEGTRLLLNRGSGLLWALRIVLNVEKAPDRDFVRRNYYKCALALGDALLIAHKCFTTKYRGRDILLGDLERDEPQVMNLGLHALYKEALAFKFRPDLVPRDLRDEIDLRTLAHSWGIVFLHVEEVRTKRKWSSLDEYALWQGTREQDQHTFKRLFRNLGRNLQEGSLRLSYPREALYRQLPILLGLTKRERGDWEKESRHFLQVWKRFN
jgi:hypothetical protein